MSQGPKGWDELSGKEQDEALMEADTANRKSWQTQRGPIRPHTGQERAELTANALPQEFHLEGTAKMNLWASQGNSGWSGKLNTAKPLRPSKAWYGLCGGAQGQVHSVGWEKAASQRRWQLIWSKPET